MKISIITVLNTINYGSALQTYATQKVFEELGLTPEFVDYWRKDQLCSSLVWRIVKEKRSSLKKWIKKPARDAMRIYSTIKGANVFRKFLESHIVLTENKYRNFEELKENIPSADIYATGSDQMWNSSWNQGLEKSFFLEYAPEGKKRIAFATSIGKTSFEESEIDEITELIKKYDFITLREQSAVDLLAKYNVKSKLVLDPTLMFDRNFWRSQYKNKDNHDKKSKGYLLVYQLHLEHDNADFNAAVKHFAQERNLEVRRITYSVGDKRLGKNIVLPDVFEFLSLIDNADFIVTDSFHGTAFSVNFNKQFACIYPDRFSTRMDNLLKLTGLEDRHFIDDFDADVFKNDVAYDLVNDILDKKRIEIKEEFKLYFSSVAKISE